MNGVDSLVGAFGRGIDKITNIVGKWGSSQPVDDSKSGIKIGDKIYQVVVSLNGCYWYLDEEGKKHPVSGIPATTEWEWINIAEKVIKDFKTCYRTPGGKVEVWSWYLLNDQMDVLKETHRITDSTDMDNPVGKVLAKIPDEWVMIDCDLPDMTERDVTFISRCYKTPNGKVEIEGLEAIDDRLNIRESIYTVIQSTDDNFQAGHVFKIIPQDWTRMVCDFPDMTERDVTYVLECYTTPGGKVQVEGLRAVDNILGVRESIFTVVQTTDDSVPVGTTVEVIPDDWVRMVCDFPDMTDREIVYVDECYYTGNGKVNLNGYQSVDAVLGVREQYYYIAKTTDVNYPQWNRIDRIPNDWTRTDCDFPDMTERHVITVNECYATPGGKVHMGGYRAVDSILGLRAEYLFVIETTDSDIPRGETMTSIPENWNKIICDFPDAATSDTEIVENCYKTLDGKVKLRTYLTLDGYGHLRESRNIILKSTDPAYNIGAEIVDIPTSWLNAECDFPDASTSDSEVVDNCYQTENGKVEIRTFMQIDGYGNVRSSKSVVLKSTDNLYPIGNEIGDIPSNFKMIECDFYSKTERHIVGIKECYSSDEGKVYVEGYKVMDNDLNVGSVSLTVLESTAASAPVGTIWISIPSGFVKISCNCNGIE